MRIRLLCLFTLSLVCFAAGAFANEPIDAEEPRQAFNPVSFLKQAIAVLLPSDVEVSGDAAASLPGLSIAFADDAETSRVSLLLAQSQLRVRLGRALEFQCEVSSRDELDAAPELGLDVGLRFEFE